MAKHGFLSAILTGGRMVIMELFQYGSHVFLFLHFHLSGKAKGKGNRGKATVIAFIVRVSSLPRFRNHLI